MKRWESSNIGIDERLGTGEETVGTRGETGHCDQEVLRHLPSKGVAAREAGARRGSGTEGAPRWEGPWSRVGGPRSH